MRWQDKNISQADSAETINRLIATPAQWQKLGDPWTTKGCSKCRTGGCRQCVSPEEWQAKQQFKQQLPKGVRVNSKDGRDILRKRHGNSE
jgi:hypothetical protein